MADDCRVEHKRFGATICFGITKASSRDCVMLSVAGCPALKSLDERRTERNVRQRSGFVMSDDLDTVNAALWPHQ
jgi:hypothetical protein